MSRDRVLRLRDGVYVDGERYLTNHGYTGPDYAEQTASYHHACGNKWELLATFLRIEETQKRADASRIEMERDSEVARLADAFTSAAGLIATFGEQKVTTDMVRKGIRAVLEAQAWVDG